MSFNVNDLSAWQITASCLGAVPLLSVFGANMALGMNSKWWKDRQAELKKRNEFVVGQPRRKWFGIIWFLVLALVFLGSFLSAINFTTEGSIALTVFTLVFALLAIMWLYVYKTEADASDKRRTVGASRVLFMALLIAMGAFTVAFTSPVRPGDESTRQYARMAVSLCYVPLVVWVTVASSYNILEVNK